jgi:hypothetical protein
LPSTPCQCKSTDIIFLLLKITHQEESIIAVSVIDSCNVTVRVAITVSHLGRFQVPII